MQLSTSRQSSISQYELPDIKQNYWQLASIQNASLGLFALNLGAHLSKNYGPGSAVISILIGNLALWIIGLGIIAMAYNDRKNAIENLFIYIGRGGALFAGIIFIFAFLLWYPLQLRTALTSFEDALVSKLMFNNSFYIRLAVVLGLVISLLSLGGIKLIKWFCLYSFPFLGGFVLYAVFRKTEWPNFDGTWKWTLAGTVLTLSFYLPGTINLPTFFRHARTRVDAFLALSIMNFFYSYFEITGVFIGHNAHEEGGILNYLNGNNFDLFVLSAFILVSLVSVNLVNIYFSSAVWEILTPKMRGAKGYAIVGMAGTVIFIFIQVWEPLFYLVSLVDNWIANLGIVILIGYLMKIILNHRARMYDKILNFICWGFGCAISFLYQNQSAVFSAKPFFYGVSSILILFLFVLFVEEVIWSSHKCFSKDFK